MTNDFSVICCNLIFESKAKFDYHQRNVHQQVIEIRKNNELGKSILTALVLNYIMILVRFQRENNVFTCMCGTYSHEIPQKLRRHFLNCDKYYTNRIEPVEELEDNDDDFQSAVVNTDTEIYKNDIIESSLLKKYNLVMNSTHNLLLCKSCKYVIEEGSIVNHVMRNHRSIVETKYLKKEEELMFLEELYLIAPLVNSNLNMNK